MALVLFGILFLFGAVGMERRRAVIFSIVTGVLLFGWMVPVIVQTDASAGIVYLALELVVVLLGLLLLSLISYFAGRWARILLNRLPWVARRKGG
jgi:hypothetical protein